MSISLIIILSDSEDEIELAPVSPPVSPNHNSSSSEPEEYIPESEPEVESKESRVEAPLPSPYHIPGTLKFRIPLKRIADSNDRGKAPAKSAPSSDPFKEPIPPPDTKFHKVQEILGKWRKLDIFPSQPELGESSKVQFPITHEPPHYTIPILVAHVARQDDRLDFIEDTLMDMPTMTTLEARDQEINNLHLKLTETRQSLGGLMHEVNDNLVDLNVLRKKVGEMDAKMANLEELVQKLIDGKKDDHK